jgi:hypothetical protein
VGCGCPIAVSVEAFTELIAEFSVGIDKDIESRWDVRWAMRD